MWRKHAERIVCSCAATGDSAAVAEAGEGGDEQHAAEV